MLVALRLQFLQKIEIKARRLNSLRDFERARGHRDHAEPGWQHESFLTASDERIDAPFVHLLLEDADRGDSIDDQHRIAPASYLANRSDRMHRASGSLAS